MRSFVLWQMAYDDDTSHVEIQMFWLFTSLDIQLQFLFSKPIMKYFF